jgi:putative ATPase
LRQEAVDRVDGVDVDGGDGRPVAAEPTQPVLHLRNAVTPLMKAVGHGHGYRYAHDDPEARAGMTCLPEGLAGRVYFEPDPPDTPPSSG